MRARPTHALLVTAALSCTGSQPTEIKSDLLTANDCGVTVTANPLSVNKLPGTDNTATFAVKNTCGSASGPVDFTASRTGAVTSTSTITPSVIPSPGLTANQSKNVTVAYHTGATPGSGTVVLTATRDATSPPTVSSGSQTVDVSNGGPATPPTVLTKDETLLTYTGVTLNGSANPNGASTTGWFRYSTTNPGTCNDTFGTRVPSSGTALGAGTTPKAYTAAVSGLTGKKVYYFCAIASNSGGTRFGDVLSFMTGGLPFGPTDLWPRTGTLTADVSSFTMSMDFTSWSNQGLSQPHILKRIADARAKGLKLVLAMTGGSHDQYLKLGPNGTDSVFDIEKWKHGNPAFAGSGMDGYKLIADGGALTQAQRDVIIKAIADGVILGNNVMDEPPHSSWGGVMTKPIVDQMCEYVKGIFPTLPVGVVAVQWWHRNEHYQVCDFIISQFEYDVKPGGGPGFDTPTAFRDSGLVVDSTDHVSVVFSMNLLHGGTADGTCGHDCPMNTTQVRDAGLTLGRDGAGLLMWQYNAGFMANNQSAFSTIFNDLKARPMKSWRRH